MISRKTAFVGLMTGAILVAAQTARAYVDLAPTLPRIITDSPTIAVVEVTTYDPATHTVTLKPIQNLKGDLPNTAITQQVAPIGGSTPRQIVQWATPGGRAVLFQTRTAARGTALVSFGYGWYQVNSNSSGNWRLGTDRPDLPLSYYGSVPRLIDAVQSLLQGDGVVITNVAYGNDSAAASFDLALNRQALPAIIKLQRVRTEPTLTGSSIGSTHAFIGLGVVDERDLPDLLAQLQSPDLAVQLQAVEDLRTLGRKAKEAAPLLTPLLTHPNPRLRFAAASALLRITPKDPQPAIIILAGLTDSSPAVRRLAANSAGYCGPAGEPFAEKLTALLNDSEESVRLTALESISALGPAAAKALPALTQMLGNKELAIDAADALGRIGPAAAPAIPKLIPLLSSPQLPARWAAVRALSQIGGPDAHPAVDFMVRTMNGASEVEGYNMMIYFALLGPVAQDALPSLQAFLIKNPMLANAAQWAIKLDRFPWDYPEAPRTFNLIGGSRNNMAGFSGPYNELHFAAMVRELGPRLAKLAPALARAIMEKKAGNVPLWGYDLLRAAPDQTLAALTPNLRSADLALRERAAVALGYMGEDALPAKPQIEDALAQAPTQREKNLLQWTLRKIDGD